MDRMTTVGLHVALCLLLSCCCFSLTTASGEETYREVGFPDPGNPQELAACGVKAISFICDPSNRLTESEMSKLNNLIRSLRDTKLCPCDQFSLCYKAHSHTIKVALVPRIQEISGGFPDTSVGEFQVVRSFAERLRYEEWKVDSVGKGCPLVAFIVLDLHTKQELAERLKTEKGKLIAVKCDLTKEEEILAMFEDIKNKHGGLDVCINNAGLCHAEPLFTGRYDQWRNMMDVNVMALAICSQEAFKSMKARGVDDGVIIHIGSIAGHYVDKLNLLHFYSATKFAVRALLEGMRNELREMNSNIRVAEISPGLVETEFAGRMMGEEMAKGLFKRMQSLKADDITDAVTYIMSAPQHVSVHDIILRPTQQP